MKTTTRHSAEGSGTTDLSTPYLKLIAPNAREYRLSEVSPGWASSDSTQLFSAPSAVVSFDMGIYSRSDQEPRPETRPGVDKAVGKVMDIYGCEDPNVEAFLHANADIAALLEEGREHIRECFGDKAEVRCSVREDSDVPGSHLLVVDIEANMTSDEVTKREYKLAKLWTIDAFVRTEGQLILSVLGRSDNAF